MIQIVGRYLVVCVSVEVETSVNNALERVILVTNWIHYPYLSSGQCLVHMILKNKIHAAIINKIVIISMND